jgi:hypothetical protein
MHKCCHALNAGQWHLRVCVHGRPCHGDDVHSADDLVNTTCCPGEGICQPLRASHRSVFVALAADARRPSSVAITGKPCNRCRVVQCRTVLRVGASHRTLPLPMSPSVPVTSTCTLFTRSPCALKWGILTRDRATPHSNLMFHKFLISWGCMYK